MNGEDLAGTVVWENPLESFLPDLRETVLPKWEEYLQNEIDPHIDDFIERYNDEDNELPAIERFFIEC